MEKKRELLILASNMADFKEESVLKKVQQIAQNVYSKNKDLDECKEELQKILGLYYLNPSILSGGETFKQKFKSFIKDWLKIDSKKNSPPEWNENEYSKLNIEEFIYVVAWAAKTAAKNRKCFRKLSNSTKQKTETKTSTGSFSNKPFEDILKGIKFDGK